MTRREIYLALAIIGFISIGIGGFFHSVEISAMAGTLFGYYTCLYFQARGILSSEKENDDE